MVSVRASNSGGRRNWHVMHPPASLHRPLPHPSLWRDTQEIGGERQGLMGVDLPCHRTEVDHSGVRPVGRQTAQIDRPGPFADRLRAPAAEILVDEEGRRIGALGDDRQLLREWFQRRHVDAIDALAVAAPGEDSNPCPEARRGQRRIEGGPTEDAATIRLDVADDLADDQVVRRPLGLHPLERPARAERLPLAAAPVAATRDTWRQRRISRLLRLSSSLLSGRFC